LTTLSNTGGYGVQYVGHIGTAPATGLNRTNSSSKVFGTSPGRHFMTQGKPTARDPAAHGAQRTTAPGVSNQKGVVPSDKSLKGVLSGKNLFNLTQSAAAR
jgi:hypothetical protein